MIHLRSIDHHRLTVFTLVAFCVAGVSNGGAAQVLCIGQDGHVEVEASGVGCCTDSAESAPADRSVGFDATHHTDVDHCGACIDIPLMASSQRVVESSSVKRPAIAIEVANLAFTDHVGGPVALFSRASHSLRSPALSGILPLLL